MTRLVVACALACGLLAACGSDRGSGAGANRSDSPGNASATGELVYFTPSYLPDGYRIESTDLQNAGQLEDPVWTAKVGRSSGAKTFVDLVTVLVTKAGPERDSEPSGYESVDVNGHAAHASDTPITGAIVMWEQDGLSVGVVGPPGKRDDALAVARGLRVDADVTKTHLADVPAGMEIVAEWGSNGYPRERYTVNAEATDTNGSIDAVRISVTLVPADFAVATIGAGHEVRADRTARGHVAYGFRSANDIGGRTLEQFTLAWGERTDLVVSISGTVELDELQAVADGLKEESESQWRAHVKVQ